MGQFWITQREGKFIVRVKNESSKKKNKTDLDGEEYLRFK